MKYDPDELKFQKIMHTMGSWKWISLFVFSN